VVNLSSVISIRLACYPIRYVKLWNNCKLSYSRFFGLDTQYPLTP
jgi:hypothetical protein